MCSHRSPRGDRRCSKEESIPLFVLFVLFGQAKRTLKEKNHKVNFLLSYFCMTKSTKSQQGGLAPSSFQTTAACTSQSREPCVASTCGTGQSKSRWFCALRNLDYTTRANISHEKAEQIRARIACTPAEKRGGGRESNMCADGMERVYFGLVQIALFTNKKLRQEIRGFPALYFRLYNFSAPYTKAFASLNFSAPYTKAFASLNFSTPYTKAFASLNFSTPYTKVSFAYFSFQRKVGYFIASSTATATATVAPTIGLLPIPISPIISTCAGTEEEPAN